MKTLIAEDNLVNRLLLHEILKTYGETRFAVDGKEAVESFKTALEAGEPFKLICLDIMMPEMDGREVLRHIRKIEEENGILNGEGAKIIMTTALRDKQNVIKSFKEQCDGYIFKPIQKEKLLNYLKDFGLIKNNMKILVVEDDLTSRQILKVLLSKWNYEVIPKRNGKEAIEIMKRPDAPELIILDWMMPEMDGLEVCKRIRKDDELNQPYIILLTAKGGQEDIVKGLKAGADDFVTKPFDNMELQARISVGRRIIDLQNELKDHVQSLKSSVHQIQDLHDISKICPVCNKIGNKKNVWKKIELYYDQNFGIKIKSEKCPDCR